MITVLFQHIFITKHCRFNVLPQKTQNNLSALALIVCIQMKLMNGCFYFVECECNSMWLLVSSKYMYMYNAIGIIRTDVSARS